MDHHEKPPWIQFHTLFLYCTIQTGIKWSQFFESTLCSRVASCFSTTEFHFDYPFQCEHPSPNNLICAHLSTEEFWSKRNRCFTIFILSISPKLLENLKVKHMEWSFCCFFLKNHLSQGFDIRKSYTWLSHVEEEIKLSDTCNMCILLCACLISHCLIQLLNEFPSPVLCFLHCEIYLESCQGYFKIFPLTAKQCGLIWHELQLELGVLFPKKSLFRINPHLLLAYSKFISDSVSHCSFMNLNNLNLMWKLFVKEAEMMGTIVFHLHQMDWML